MLRNDKKWTIYRIFFVAICLESAFHPCWTLNTEEDLNFETRVSMNWMAAWRPYGVLSNLHQITFLFTTFAHLILSFWETSKRNVRFLSDNVWEDFTVFCPIMSQARMFDTSILSFYVDPNINEIYLLQNMFPLSQLTILRDPLVLREMEKRNVYIFSYRISTW